ncbi:MAG: Si-specific NAD(P)(+) transhydrogenase [Planctomycetota bacterium]
MHAATPFDLVVLGAGPAGVHAAIAGALLGKSVALIERGTHIGGALVNTGTLPSKTLRETALTLAGVRARGLQVDVALRHAASVGDLLRHERSVAETERERLGGMLDELRVKRFAGTARFADPHTVEVLSNDVVHAHVRGEKIVIATGSSPSRPAEFPFEHARVYDSDEILALGTLPRRLAVIGAGVIGAEYACTFAALGAEVHLVDGRDVLLPFLDAELSRALADAMAANGIRFHWKERVLACAAPPDGDITLELSSTAHLTVDSVLVAAGRRSNVDALALDKAGLAAGERGLLAVDEAFRTSVPHIHAVGDVIGFPSLASTSMEQARLAVCLAFDMPYKREISALLPSGIYTIPEASCAGATEEQLRERGEDYIAGRARYAQNSRGTIIGDRQGFLKLLFRRADMKLLGVHVLGELATELVHIGLMTMICGGGAAELNAACFNVPTLSELYKAATYRAQLARDRPNGMPASEW